MEDTRQKLEGTGLKFLAADLARIPDNTITLDKATAKKNLKLIDVLTEHDDVQEVYSNFDIPEQIMAEINEETD